MNTTERKNEEPQQQGECRQSDETPKPTGAGGKREIKLG